MTPPGAELPLADPVVREGDAAEEIHAYADENAVDLVVLGSHRRHPVERLLTGSVAARVTRHASCPTLIVPLGTRPSFARVMCAVDLSPSSIDTVDQAAAIARATGAHLILAHVVEAPPRYGYEPWMLAPDDEDDARRALDEDARSRLADLLVRHAHGGLTIELRVVFGDARSQIERLGASADLLVLGLRSRRSMDQLLFGSTTRHMLRVAAAPILLVPHSKDARRQEQTATECAGVA
jgi:nucleotide-binding universal stress UspA family protein